MANYLNDDDEEEEEEDGIEEEDAKVSAVEYFYDNGTSIESDNKVYALLKEMCHSTSIAEMPGYVMKIMQLLELGRSEGDKGSTSFDTKTKSFQQRWFRKRGNGNGNDRDEKKASTEDDSASIYIERDSLISLNCQRGGASSVEHYRVLALFTKHYKKWYPSYDPQKFLWNKESKDVRFLVSMVKKDGSAWKEAELEKDSEFGPSCVFRVCSMNEVLNVEGTLHGDGVLF